MENKMCQICGEEIENARANRLYCWECGKNPERARARFKAALAANRYHAGETEPIFSERVCKQCGKPYATSTGRLFCGPSCEEAYKIEHATCLVCGMRLIDAGVEVSSWRGYCSVECRAAARYDRAKAKGRVKKCKICGKEFIGATEWSLYCGRECSAEGTKRRTLEKAKNKQAAFVPRMKECPTCGKRFEPCQKTKKYCSPECREAASKTKTEQNRKPKALSMQPGETTHLCATCKTSYVDCEWMQSKFRYLPKGAVMREVGGKHIVVSCPRHRK